MGEEKDKKWTFEWKQLLLTTRLQSERDFVSKKKKRSVVWEKVLQEIKLIDSNFPFNRDEIMRKYLNFMVTYKRIKTRNCASGESSTSWEFFDQMDEVYGTRSKYLLSDGIDSTATSDPPKSPQDPPQKRARCEVLEFLRNESDADKEIMKQFLECEKEKLRIEKTKIEEIKKLREVLCEVLSRTGSK